MLKSFAETGLVLKKVILIVLPWLQAASGSRKQLPRVKKGFINTNVLWVWSMPVFNLSLMSLEALCGFDIASVLVSGKTWLGQDQTHKSTRNRTKRFKGWKEMWHKVKAENWDFRLQRLVILPLYCYTTSALRGHFLDISGWTSSNWGAEKEWTLLKFIANPISAVCPFANKPRKAELPVQQAFHLTLVLWDFLNICKIFCNSWMKDDVRQQHSIAHYC